MQRTFTAIRRLIANRTLRFAARISAARRAASRSGSIGAALAGGRAAHTAATANRGGHTGTDATTGPASHLGADESTAHRRTFSGAGAYTRATAPTDAPAGPGATAPTDAPAGPGTTAPPGPAARRPAASFAGAPRRVPARRGSAWRTNARRAAARQALRRLLAVAVLARRRSGLAFLAVALAAAAGVILAQPGHGLGRSESKPAPQAQEASAPLAAAGEDAPQASLPASLIIPVYLTKEKTIERVPLEEYVRGVVAAEMPIEFELEALKAQALAARTYLIRRLAEQDYSGVPVKDAWVTDTVQHQAYLSLSELKQRWTGEAYTQNMDKLNRVIKETAGKILTYEDKPINALFFSTSNGYTENSEDYWGFYLPYLRSVPSPWDVTLSPEYRETVTLPLKEFASRLGIGSAVPASAAAGGMKVVQKSEGKRILKLTIAGKPFTGREVREKLGLNSTQFQWTVKGSSIQITTFGYGHGVGMSQWGADGMALEGKTAEEIAAYYYTGIQISEDTKYLQEGQR